MIANTALIEATARIAPVPVNQIECGVMRINGNIEPYLNPLQSWLFITCIFYIVYRGVFK
jgi:hypothetical protein